MSRSLSVYRTLAACVAVTAFAAVFSSPALAAGAKARLSNGSTSQAAIASKKKISVDYSGATAPYAVQLKLQSLGGATGVNQATAGAETSISATTNGTVAAGTIAVTVSSTGLKAVAKCNNANLNVYVNGRKVDSERLTLDSNTCVTATAPQCDAMDPSECLYPFPNDYFTRTDSSTSTGRRLNLDPLAMPITATNLFAPTPKPFGVTELNRFDGFSPGSMLITKIPGLESRTALIQSKMPTVDNIGRYSQSDAGVVVIDAATGQRWPVWAEPGDGYTDATQDGVDTTPTNDMNLVIHPAKNFLDGHRYIVALRNLKTATGKAIPAGYGFKVFRDKIKTKNSAIEGRKSHMEALFTKLTTAGISRSSVNLAWDFTVASTRSLSERALKVRNDAFSQLGDTTMGDNVIQGNSPVWHITSISNTPSDPDTIRQVDGTIEVPCYLDSAGCVTGGKFKLGSDGLPTQTSGNKQLARFRCDIPKSAVDGDGPIYMTLYGHGLFGSIGELNSRNVRQFGNENRMLVCGSDWSGMASEDELTAAGILSDLTNFPKLADRLQQGYLNFMFLGRALAHPSGLTTDSAFSVSSGGNSSSYNTGYIAYYGNSQGGIAGGGLTALSPDVTRSVLYVGAMNYSLLLTRSVDFDEFKAFFYPNYTKLRERPLLFGLMQIMWDRGEPNGYANHITSNPLPNTPVKHVTMEMSFGDHQVSNIANLVEARTLNLKVRQPWLNAGRDTNGGVSPWGLTTLGALPLDDNAIIAWDIGPYRTPESSSCKDHSSDTWCGTPSPPADNSPNRVGTDPHDFNIETMATLRHQIAEFIKPNGHLIDVCGGLPCYGGHWAGS